MMNRILSAEIENASVLTKDEQSVLNAIAFGANPEYKTLDEAEKYLRSLMLNSDWFVYRGGSHVALHKISVMNRPRVLIIKENR